MIMIDLIEIGNPEVVRDIRLLAEIMHQPIDDVVAELVREKLGKAQRSREAIVAERLRRVAEIRAEIAALPIIGEALTDADLYDEGGLPR